MKKYFAAVALVVIAAAALMYYCCTKPIHIVAVGDILLSRGVTGYLEERGYDYPYEDVKEEIKKADIAVANLECPLTDRGKAVLKIPELIFRGSSSNGISLKNAGFDLLNLANNHTMDYDRVGLTDTMKLLENCGVMTVGAGMNRSEARKPVFIEKRGRKIGFLSYSQFPPEGYIYDENKADVARLDMESLSREVRSAKKQCDFLVVSFHWGKEYDNYPSDSQREAAHLSIESGGDVVIGHHPHVLQSIEEYRGKLIFYSLGNFIFDRQSFMGTDESVIIDVSVGRNRCRDIRIIPIRIKDCKPVIARGKEAEALLNKYESYSEDYGVEIIISDGIGYIKPMN